MNIPASVRVGAFMAALFGTFAIVGAFLPLFMADGGLSARQIGTVLGIASLVRIFTGPSWGMLADRLGQRRVVMTSAAGIAACTALGLLAARAMPDHAFLIIVVLIACQGAATSALGPLSDSLALGLAREGKIQYGPPRAAGSASFMMISAIGGQIVGLFGTVIVPFLLAGGFITAALVARGLPEPVNPAPAGRRFVGGLAGAVAVLRIPEFRLTLLASALVQGSHAAFYSFAPLHWRSFGIADGTIGLLIAIGIVAEVAFFMWGRRLIEFLGPAGLTLCAATAGVVRWSVTAVSGDLVILFAVQALHAVTFAFQHQSSMLMLQRVIPPERASTAQALHMALGAGVPMGAMTFISGLIYARHGGQLYFLMALLCALALPLVPFLRRSVDAHLSARNTRE